MHATLVMQHRSRADTDHDIMRFVVGSFRKWNVMTATSGKSNPFARTLSCALTSCCASDPVIMHSKKETILAENIGKFRSRSFGFLKIAVLNRDINFTFQTGAHPNQSGAMLG